MASRKPKKSSTNKSYYWFLLLPVAALVVVAILLIPRSKHYEWDDDDDEDDPQTERRENSANGLFTDEEILNFPDAPELEWGGNSPAFLKKVAPGIVISARENAFEQPTEVKFRFATETEHKKAVKAVEQQLQHHIPLFTFDLDAGLEAGQHIPGTFKVELDLEKLQVPEEIWDGLSVSRIDENGFLQEWNCRVEDGKFGFDTDRNCLWVITCCAVAALAVKIGASTAFAASTLVLAGGFPYYHLLSYHYAAYGFKPLAYLTFKDPKCGMVRIGFLPEETEHPNPDNYWKVLKKIDKRLDKLKKEAEQEEQDTQEYHRSLRNDNNPIPIYIGIEDQYSFAKLYTQRINTDSELEKLLKDHDLETPQSILNIKRMVQVSLSYLATVQGLKVPGSVCPIYLGNEKLTSEQLGAYNNIMDASPWIGVLYANKYVRKVNGKMKINDVEGDKIFITICHEMFHHFHSGYVFSNAFKDSRLTEAGASVLEREFSDWLYDLGKLHINPRSAGADRILDFVDRSNKHWLLGSLCSPIAPTRAKLDQLLQLCKAYVMVMIRAAVINANVTTPYATMVSLEEFKNSLHKMEDALSELSERAYLSIEQLIDLYNFTGEALKGGANCDAGYMLGDFIDYLRKHVNERTTLHDILMYGSGWDVAKALQQAFEIETEEKFYEQYEGFVKENMKKIVDSQTLFRDSLRYRDFYREQLLEPVMFNRVECVQKLACWTKAGPYACRTVNFLSGQGQGNYNLMLVPSRAMKGNGEKAVKAAILKGDSVIAPTPYYLEADSNGNRSPEHVVLLFTNKMSEVSLSDDHYYDAVAYYAPKVRPKMDYTTNGVFRLSTDERPAQVLTDMKYVTGVEFMLTDSITGEEIDSIKVALPREEREPAVGVLFLNFYSEEQFSHFLCHARWYYKPEPFEPIYFYSPWSEKAEKETGFLVNSFSYITHPGPGRVLDFNTATNPKAHLKVWSDGRFDFSVSQSNSSPAFKASGKGKINEGLEVHPANFSGFVGKIDPASFTSTGVLTVTEQERNEEGQMIDVSVEYKIIKPEEGYILYQDGIDPAYPIDVQACFKAIRKSPISGSSETTVIYIGQAEAYDDHYVNPFDDIEI